MLKIAALSVSYGGLHALVDVSLEVGEGEFVTIVGPNGAGKTHPAQGHLRHRARGRTGRIAYRGRDIGPLRAERARGARHRARPGGPARVPLAHA